MTDPQAARALAAELAARIDERLFGMETPLRLVMVGIVTGSHVLIDDVPGVGKTTLVQDAREPPRACRSSAFSSRPI